jgi:pyruvyl transferase EpsO
MRENLSQHKKNMEDLMQKHHVLLDFLANKKIVYLDIPIYGNIGDLLILQGTLAFFRKNKIKLLGIYSAYNVDENKIDKADVVVFQGGGNFGDLYEVHQKHRLEIIEKYKNKKIIVLPQTIYYQDENNFINDNKVFKSHNDLHICVRDLQSEKIANKISSNVYLLPDMAHHLYPIKTKRQSKNDSLLFKRIDKEAADVVLNEKFSVITDWDILLANQKRTIQFFRKMVRKLNKLGLKKIGTFIWLNYANYLVKKSANFFGQFSKVTTNRLHGHILSCLMNIENTVFDNSYGKNSSYIEVWTETSPLVNLQSNIDKHDDKIT